MRPEGCGQPFILGLPGAHRSARLDLTIKRMLAAPRRPRHHLATPGINEDLGGDVRVGQASGGLGRLARPTTACWAMWYGKGPGVDRCGDVFKHANFMGVTESTAGPAIRGRRSDAKSSTLPHPRDSNPPSTTPRDADPLPSRSQEALNLGLHGYALSRYSGLWVGFKIVTNIADGLATAAVGPERIAPVDPDLVIDGQRWRHVQPRRSPGADQPRAGEGDLLRPARGAPRRTRRPTG